MRNRTLVLATIVVLLVLLAALVVWQAHEAVEMFLISLVLASGVAPFATRLANRGMPRTQAVALAYGLVLLFLVSILVLFGTVASSELAAAIEFVPRWYETVRSTLATSTDWRGALGGFLPSTATIATYLAASGPAALSTFLVGLTGTTLGWAIHLLTTFSLGFYWLLDKPRFQRLWFSLLPLNVRSTARDVMTQVANEVGVYVRSVAVTVTFAVLCLFSIYSLLGIPGAMLLALVGGLAQVVPLLSLPIAIIPAGLIAATQGYDVSIATILFAFLLLVSIKRVVQTTILTQSNVNTNPVLVVFLIMLLAEMGQVFYILLAPALAAAIQVSTRILVSEQRIEAQFLNRYEQLDALRERLEIAELQVDPTSPQAPQLRDLLTRARTLVINAEEKIEDRVTAATEEPVRALQVGSLP